MNNTVKTIAKNASVLMSSQLITWVLALILAVVLPRYLGPAGVGKFELALSLLAITGVLASFGIDTLVVKHVARESGKINDIFGTILVIRFFLFLLAYAFLTLYARLANYSIDVTYLVMIFGVAALIEQGTSTMCAILAGMERMEYVSLAMVVAKIFSTVFTVALLLLHQGLLIIASVSIGSAIINFLIPYLGLRSLYPLEFKFNPKLVRWILQNSLPYMLSSVFLILYQRVDTVVMSLLVDSKQIGWYSIADQLFASLLFIPTIFMTAVFPALSRMQVSSVETANKILQKSFDLMLFMGVPIGLGIIAIADPVVFLIYGSDFAGTGPVLAVMGVVMVFTYLTILLGRYMISIDRQVTWTIVMIVATLSTVPLDLIFIPLCQRFFSNGAIGGALSFVVTELGMVVAGIIFVPKGVLGRVHVWRAVKTLTAGLIMVFAVWLVRYLFIAIPIITGVVVYMAAVIVLKVLPPEDWALLNQFAAKVIEKIRRKKVQEPVIEAK